jgi:hypothetical protein
VSGNPYVCKERQDHPVHDRLASYVGYHEFQSGKSKKAAELSETLKQRTQERIVESGSDDACSKCLYVFAHNIHHLATVDGYHEFTPVEASKAAGG